MRPASPVVECFTEIIRAPPRKGRDTSTRKGTRSKRRLRRLWFSLLGQNLLKTSLISTSRVHWLWVLCSTVTATYPSVRKKGRESVLGSTARYHHFTAGHRQGTLTPPARLWLWPCHSCSGSLPWPQPSWLCLPSEAVSPLCTGVKPPSTCSPSHSCPYPLFS